MCEFKTKEEYEAWKGRRLKAVKEIRKGQPQAHIAHAVDLKLPSQIGLTSSDILPLLLLGGLSAVFVFFILSLVLKGH